MKYMAKYSRVCWGDDVKPIQNQCQQTLHTEELCSNTCLNNCSLSEKTYAVSNLFNCFEIMTFFVLMSKNR